MNPDRDRPVLQIIKGCGKGAPAMTVAAGDSFDCIPDPLLLLIFSKLADVKALGRCFAVSKRFFDLAPKVDNAVVKVDCIITGDESRFDVKGKGILSNSLRFLVGLLMKPFQALHGRLSYKKAMPVKLPDNSPSEVLKHFKELRHLRIELPGGELGFEDGALLKWKAEFGSTLESCVILGASSFANSDDSKVNGRLRSMQHGAEQNSQAVRAEGDAQAVRSGETEVLCSEDENASIPESFYTEGGLKLRVVWTITSLIAASARHYLLQKIVLDHPTLESLVLTDAAGQGTLCMSKGQLQDFRDKPIEPSASSNRTQIPALSMKLWYAPYLELPGGTYLEGATLVAIKPSNESVCKENSGFLASAFEEPLRTAASILARRRTYILEMNSF